MWLIFQVAASVLLGALLWLALQVGGTILDCRRALRDFKRASRGLPMLEEARDPISNHGIALHLGRQTCARLTEWHAKYGKTFGLMYCKRPCASTIDLDLIRVFAHEQQQVNVNRMPFNTVVKEFERDGLFLAEGDQWRRLRRAVGPALKKYQTPNMLAEIQAAIGAFVGHLEQQVSGQQEQQEQKQQQTMALVNMDELAHKFSLDIVFRCLFKQSGLISYAADEPGARFWVETVDEALSGPMQLALPVRLALAFPALAHPLSWLMENFTRIGVWIKRINEFIEAQTRLALETRRQLMRDQTRSSTTSDEPKERRPVMVENYRLADGTQYKRFVIDHFIDAHLDGKLSAREYHNTSFLLFNAADKTLAEALSHTLYLLATHTACQEQLRAALALEGPEAAYLGWVINESLRLHPPVPLGCSRAIERDLELPNGAPGLLPARTYVLTPLYTIHRLPEYWGADANEFKPERWRDTSGHHSMQFLPFGAGLRSCPGREWALYELKRLLCETIGKFKLECAPKDDVDQFDAPYMLYTLARSPTLLKVSKVL